MTASIPPARYFDASPTWFKWNALTAADVHALRAEPAFDGQNILFYLNHPIRFVRLVGVVVQLDATRPSAFASAARWVLMTLDDGSGECMEVKIELRRPEGEASQWEADVEDLKVTFQLEGLRMWIVGQEIRVGTVVKAKGTLDAFRGVRQIRLARAAVVADTNSEAKAWAEAAQWKLETLSNPWVLTAEMMAKLEEDEKRVAEARKQKQQKRREWVARNEEGMVKREQRRVRLEERFNKGALQGSETLSTWWTG